jgi:hypothetical protein
MRTVLTAGAVAGLLAGVVFGLLMQMMSAPGPGGSSMPMMAMVAQVVGSRSVTVGWLFLVMSPLAPVRMAPMRPVAMGSLVGHLVYGLVLGLSLPRLLGRAHAPLLQAQRRV